MMGVIGIDFYLFIYFYFLGGLFPPCSQSVPNYLPSSSQSVPQGCSQDHHTFISYTIYLGNCPMYQKNFQGKQKYGSKVWWFSTI
jgi:hypothetical protein